MKRSSARSARNRSGTDATSKAAIGASTLTVTATGGGVTVNQKITLNVAKSTH